VSERERERKQVILLGCETEEMENTERCYIRQFCISVWENWMPYLLFDPLISLCFSGTRLAVSKSILFEFLTLFSLL
jgi:hypothetical protein